MRRKISETAEKGRMIKKEIERVEHAYVGTTEKYRHCLNHMKAHRLTSGTTLAELIRRPELSYEKIAPDR